VPDDASQAKPIEPRTILTVAAPVIILLLGVYLAFTIPAFGPADELAHVCRSWQIAHGGLTSEIGIDAAGKARPAGGSIPASILAVERPMKDYYFKMSTPVPQAVIDYQASVELAPQVTEYYSFPNSAVYTPLVYLQYVPAMWIGHALELRVVTMVRLARLSNVLIMALAAWGLLRFCSAYHEALFLLLTIPTAIGLYSAVTADAVTLLASIAWVLWCLHLRVAGDSTMDRRRWLITLALAASLPLCKFPYAPLLLLWLITPQATAVARGVMLRRSAIVLAFGVAAFAYAALIYLPYSRSGYSDSKVTDQVRYSIEHPMTFPAAVWDVMQNSPIGLVGATVGGFGHNDAYINGFWIIALPAVILVALLVGRSPVAWCWRDRLILIAGSGICLTAVVGFLYLAWSALGATTVAGVTGRYLLPALLPLFLAITNQQFTDLRPRRTATALVIITALAALAAALAVSSRYHG
jgi:uncharacterized membrane protein